MSNGDNRPTHGVVIPASEVLALAAIAQKNIRDAERDGESEVEAVHVPLWPSRKDGKTKVENTSREVRVYERQRDNPERPL
jgi:hypothetical protein